MEITLILLHQMRLKIDIHIHTFNIIMIPHRLTDANKYHFSLLPLSKDDMHHDKSMNVCTIVTI